MFNSQKVYQIPDFSNYYVTNCMIFSKTTKKPIYLSKFKFAWLKNDKTNKIEGKPLYQFLIRSMGDDFLEMKTQMLKNKFNVEVKTFGKQYIALNTNDVKHALFNYKKDEFLTFKKNNKGYFQTAYIDQNGKHKTIFLHVLKATCFIRPLKKNEVVHHLNFSPADCSLDNLVIMDKKTHQSLHAALKRFNKLKGQFLKFFKHCQNTNFDQYINVKTNKILKDFNELDFHLKTTKNFLA